MSSWGAEAFTWAPGAGLMPGDGFAGGGAGSCGLRHGGMMLLLLGIGCVPAELAPLPSAFEKVGTSSCKKASMAAKLCVVADAPHC